VSENSSGMPPKLSLLLCEMREYAGKLFKSCMRLFT